jgi:hypothetical protein
MVIAKWDGALDLARAERILNGEPAVEVIEEIVTVTYVDNG